MNSITYANIELLRVERGEHSTVGNHPQLIAAASEGIRQALLNNIDSASKNGKRQFRFLVAGAVFFVGWHLLQMVLRSHGR